MGSIEKEFKEIVSDKIMFAASDLLKHSLEGFIDKIDDKELLVLANDIIEKATKTAKTDLLTFITKRTGTK